MYLNAVQKGDKVKSSNKGWLIVTEVYGEGFIAETYLEDDFSYEMFYKFDGTSMGDKIIEYKRSLGEMYSW